MLSRSSSVLADGRRTRSRSRRVSSSGKILIIHPRRPHIIITAVRATFGRPFRRATPYAGSSTHLPPESSASFPERSSRRCPRVRPAKWRTSTRDAKCSPSRIIRIRSRSPPTGLPSWSYRLSSGTGMTSHDRRPWIGVEQTKKTALAPWVVFAIFHRTVHPPHPLPRGVQIEYVASEMTF